MRDLRRNLSTVYFKLYKGKKELLDKNGCATGSFELLYGDLQSARLCVGPSKGNSKIDLFGSMEDYDRAMTTANTDCPIDENAILWLDVADTQGPHNYIVKRKSQWKNSVAFAVKKVTASG